MRLVSRLTLSAVVALGSLAFAPTANAQSIIAGTQDRLDKVFEFILPNGVNSNFVPLVQPTDRRPRGIDYDRVNDDLYVGNGPDPGQSNSSYITRYDQQGNFKSQFLSNLTNVNDVDYHNGELYVSNAYIYGGGGNSDNNIYKYSTPTIGGLPAVFATLSPSVYNGDVYFNGLEFGPDGSLYAVQQTGGGGGGTGYIRRFDATTGALLDSPVDGTHNGLFGVTFDASGNMYYGAGQEVYEKNYLGGGLFGADNLIATLDTDMICDVYYATDGYLYVAGLTNHSIFKVNPTTGALLSTANPGTQDPKSDFLTEVFIPAPGLIVPEPGTIAFGFIAAGSLLGLIARKRKK